MTPEKLIKTAKIITVINVVLIIVSFIALYIGLTRHPVVLDGACIQGVVFVPKLVRDGGGTSDLTYEECKE